MIDTNYLRELRLAMNLNKSQTARLLNTTISKYCALENGKKSASVATLSKIKRLMNADLNKLIIN